MCVGEATDAGEFAIQMKLIPLPLLVIALIGCTGVSEVLPGPDTNKVYSRMDGVFNTYSDAKASSIKRASEYCDARHERMTIVSWETRGTRGATPLEATLIFKCVSPSSNQ